jgi:hypothetical protein
MKLNEYQAVKQMQMQRYEEEKFMAPDINQVQGNMQDYI